MNTPQYQFNLGNPDPILAGGNYNVPDYFKSLDDEIARLKDLKQRMVNPPQQVPVKVSVWEEIDKEITALTDEQKSILAQDETYVSIDRELQMMIQQELINSVKGNVEATPRGKELLDAQLKNIRDKKKHIVEASNKEMELFKKFQIAVQANPNLTYAEFVKSIK